MRSPQPADPRSRLRTLLTLLWSYALCRAADLAELTPGTPEEGDLMLVSFDIYIKAPPQRVWDVFTDVRLSPYLRFGATLECDYKVGSRIPARLGDGPPATDGTILESDPPHRLVRTWEELWNPEAAQEPPSRVTYEFLPMGEGITHVRGTHDLLIPGSTTAELTAPGWPMVLSSLKTLVETGEPLGISFDLAQAHNP
jgi:uncharacterized protein YndB with AHSA1/START domain